MFCFEIVTQFQAARLAQSVEHQTFNLRVRGSSPLMGLPLFKPYEDFGSVQSNLNRQHNGGSNKIVITVKIDDTFTT